MGREPVRRGRGGTVAAADEPQFAPARPVSARSRLESQRLLPHSLDERGIGPVPAALLHEDDVLAVAGDAGTEAPRADDVGQGRRPGPAAGLLAVWESILQLSTWRGSSRDDRVAAECAGAHAHNINPQVMTS